MGRTSGAAGRFRLDLAGNLEQVTSCLLLERVLGLRVPNDGDAVFGFVALPPETEPRYAPVDQEQGELALLQTSKGRLRLGFGIGRRDVGTPSLVDRGFRFPWPVVSAPITVHFALLDMDPLMPDLGGATCTPDTVTMDVGTGAAPINKYVRVLCSYTDLSLSVQDGGRGGVQVGVCTSIHPSPCSIPLYPPVYRGIHDRDVSEQTGADARLHLDARLLIPPAPGYNTHRLVAIFYTGPALPAHNDATRHTLLWDHATRQFRTLFDPDVHTALKISSVTLHTITLADD